MIQQILFIIFLDYTSFLYSSSNFYVPEKIYKSYKTQELFDGKIEDKSHEQNESSYHPYTKQFLKPVMQPKYIIAEEQRLKEKNKALESEDLSKIKDQKEENQSNKIESSINFIEKKNLTEKNNQPIKTQQEDKNIQNLFDPLTTQPRSINMNTIFEIPGEVFDDFDKFINKMTLTILKNSKYISPHTKISQVNLSEIVIETLKKYLFLFLKLPDKIKTTTDIGNALNNFRIEIQYLAEQIKNYNGKKYYTNPQQMLILIKIINRFLKEADAQNISREISIKFDNIYTKSAICCALFEGQNIIFSTEDTPTKILSFFQTSIANTNNLTQLQEHDNIMQIIYGKNGYMDQILEKWIMYQNSNLYKNKINRSYGAFITFLLIFQNSIVAAANVLDKTSSLYKVTNPIPLIINMNIN